MTARGTILTWGANDGGQLGTGMTASHSRVPVVVHLPFGRPALSVSVGPVSRDTLAVT